MASVEANGITIEYEEHGSGDPLLLVMGLGGQLVDWPPAFIERLVEEGFRVVRFDNRDIGLSTELADADPPTRWQLAKSFVTGSIPSAYDLSDMADDAVGLLDALGIESAHVVGMSMGGMIAQTLAMEHPERVRSLVSVMSTTGNRRVGRPTARVARLSLRRPEPNRDDALDRAVAFFREISGSGFDDAEFRDVAKVGIERSWRPEGTARQLAAIIASGDRTERLAQVDVPTLVVHGLADTLVKPSGGTATASAIPGSQLLMFNDMGHDLPSSRHAEIATAIRSNADRADARV